LPIVKIQKLGFKLLAISMCTYKNFFPFATSSSSHDANCTWQTSATDI